MKRMLGSIILFLAAGIFLHSSSWAVVGSQSIAKADTVKEEKKEKKKEEEEKKSEKKKKPKEPKFEDLIEGYEKIEGFFTLYWNEKEGKVYLEIKPDQWDEIYLCNVTRQSGDGTLFDSGAMLGQFPFFFHRVGKRLQFIYKNVLYRADKNAAIYRAVESNLPNSIMGSAKIASQPHPETGSVLIDAAELFLVDWEHVAQLTGRLKMGYSFDKTNSYFSQLKSFPLNTEIEVTLHFKSSKRNPIFTLPNPRSMIHRYHFSLSALPETDYRPRIADDRVGHFLTMYQDYTSLLEETPYKRYIDRWQLEKAEPKFKISKPKKPIVFWLENTIPVEYREAVREGVLLWNDAFEKIGFKDAIEVRQMPDDAEWDPADVRYSTIRWIVQPGGGYAVGPHRANPFTGQIYDADVRISADFVRFYYREFDEFVNPLSWTQLFNRESAFFERPSGEENTPWLPYQCQYADGLSRQMAFGWSWLVAQGTVTDDPEAMKKFLHDAIVELVAHEVGHTLGLRHNFKASSVYRFDQLTEGDFVRKKGLTGSVMDYNPVFLNPKMPRSVPHFQTRLGPYDYWAIEYAYRPLDPGSKKSEQEMLEEIASRAPDPLLQYGTDEDAFGFSTRGIDPTCNLFDLGDDPIAYYQQRLELAQELWKKIPKKFEKKGQRYQKFRLVFGQGLGEYGLAALVVPKYIGGIYMHRDHIGDPGGRPPFEMVPAEKQRAALHFLIKNYFAPEAFQFDPEFLNKLAPERFWDFQGTVFRMWRLDFPIHGVVQVLQATALLRLYDPLVLQRIQDNEIRFPKGEKPFTMAELFQGVRNAVWQELDQGSNINSFRRELQRMHLQVLNRMLVKSPAMIPHDAITLARADLVTIQQKIERVLGSAQLDAYTTAHLQETAAKIKAVLNAQVQQGL